VQFEVRKGIVKHKGAFYPKGSFFLAEREDVESLLKQGAIAPAEEGLLGPILGDPTGKKAVPPVADMTIEELKRYLETAEDVEEVRALLEAEMGKTEPRKTAVRLLEDWLNSHEAATEDEEDLGLPDFDGGDVVVDGEEQ